MSLIDEAMRNLRNSGKAAVVRAELPPAPAGTDTQKKRKWFGDPERSISFDVDKLRNANLMVPEDEERFIASQYRSVKVPLIKDTLRPAETPTPDNGRCPSRAILIASALSGEGKTFTTLNLAMSLARERDSSVLLVDGDTAKPQLSHVLGVHQQDGLIELLTQPERSVLSAVCPTSLPGLSFLPAGRPSDSTAELLSSARMLQVLRELIALDPRLLVVFDSPPILLTSEARALAGLFGQIVMVVRSGTTPQHAVIDALELLGADAPVKLLLNDAVHSKRESYYGYGYAYGGDRVA